MGGQSPSVTGGAGGVDLGSSAASRSGDASGLSGSGNKVFNFGANPNMSSSQVVSALTNPLVIAGFVVAFWLYSRKRK